MTAAGHDRTDTRVRAREAMLLQPPKTLLGLRVALQAAAVAGRIFGRSRA